MSSFGLHRHLFPSTVFSVIHLFFFPPCFMPSLLLSCHDLLAIVTFLPLISLLESTRNTVDKVIFLVHRSDHLTSRLSLSGGFLSHYTTRSNFSSSISRLHKSTNGPIPYSFLDHIQLCLLCAHLAHVWLSIPIHQFFFQCLKYPLCSTLPNNLTFLFQVPSKDLSLNTLLCSHIRLHSLFI